MSRYMINKKNKKNSRKLFTVFNENKEVLTTVNDWNSINYSQLQSSSSITIVASRTDFIKYKKQEELYIKHIDSIFE